MLLLNQIGSVKIGEVVRYTVTYTPAHDRILPAPEYLYLRIRNTCTTALRAAFVHGPYSLYVDAYPANFNPNEKFENPRQYGVPEFEPMLKAGGTWACRLTVPENIRHDAGSGGAPLQPGSRGSGSGGGGMDESYGLSLSYRISPGDLAKLAAPPQPPSATWTINISSQVIFSTSAAVHYEILLARDPKSLDIGTGVPGIPVMLGGGSPNVPQAQVLQPGRVSDYQRGRDGHHPEQPKGVFSRAIRLRIEDTAGLWNKPQLPGWDHPPGRHETAAAAAARRGAPKQPAPASASASQQQTDPTGAESQSPQAPQRKVKKVHLVVLTHGLHSNLGADMLYLKESIDAAVQQAKVDRKVRRARERAEAAAARGEEYLETDEHVDGDDEDDEEVIVRGYSGNATKTERGIKYLGKRLARYVLNTTYPDQPFLPSSKNSAAMRAAQGEEVDEVYGPAPGTRGVPAKNSSTASLASRQTAHKHSTIVHAPHAQSHRLYKFTKISFIGHSLGGLIQTYAVAYIQKHSPQFFDLIQPINFITMASPLLGLNHENPLYVKFALDFGLVGRSGQDLGLTWRAPTLARSSWGAIVNLGETAHKTVMGESRPESKPLLRILPTGPAHTALKKFRNRTVYSNVVNDGIVPLRTSCLLFLDWQGLGRVEKARRETGLIETVVGAGWAELIGANVSTGREEAWEEGDDISVRRSSVAGGDVASTAGNSVEGYDAHEVPQPSSTAMLEDDRQSIRAISPPSAAYLRGEDEDSQVHASSGGGLGGWMSTGVTNNNNPISTFFNNFFKTGDASDAPESLPPTSNTQAAAVQASSSSSSSTSHAQPSPRLNHTPSFGNHHHKQNPIYQRSQTLRFDQQPPSPTASPLSNVAKSDADLPSSSNKSRVTSGQELSDETMQDITGGNVTAPPKTSFFESATDIINPKLPPVEYLIDPSRRPRAIFHDRIYHPSDIPPPPLKRRPTGGMGIRTLSFQKGSTPSGANSRADSPYEPMENLPRHDSILSSEDYDDRANMAPGRSNDEVVDSASMKVEEKIARAYHRGLSWRKVLVKLEPDAHNNMIVRRMLANAFGWPVVKHLVDAHFSDSADARISDDAQINTERARPLDETPSTHGTETRTPKAEDPEINDDSKAAADETRPLSLAEDTGKGAATQAADTLDKKRTSDNADGSETTGKSSTVAAALPMHLKAPESLAEPRDSATWSDRDWLDSDDSELEDEPAASSGKEAKKQGGRGKQVNKNSTVTASPGTTTGPVPPLGMVDSPLGGDGWNWKEKIVGKQAHRTSNMAAKRRSRDGSSGTGGDAGGHGGSGSGTGTK